MSQGSNHEGNKNPLIPQHVNHFQIVHNAFEFIIDFGNISEEDGMPIMKARMAANPACAKLLLETLTQAISSYESTFGVINNLEQKK